MRQSEDGSQERILRAFTILHRLREHWGGALILNCGLSPQGAALSLASNIAGAVCLSMEQDPDLLKDALRSGACDFIVNTLDEALRAMKNEIRKHLPLSVGLQGHPSLILKELLERGVRPELFIGQPGDSGQRTPEEQAAYDDAIRQFKSLGALIVDFDGNPSATGVINAENLLDTFVRSQQWHLRSFVLSTPATLRAFDSRALSLIPTDDNIRRKWLQAAPRILPRERPIRRVLWVTSQEEQALQAEFPPTT